MVATFRQEMNMPPFELHLEEPPRPPIQRTIRLANEKSAVRLLARLVRKMADETSDGFAIRIAGKSGAPVCSFELITRAQESDSVRPAAPRS